MNSWRRRWKEDGNKEKEQADQKSVEGTPENEISALEEGGIAESILNADGLGREETMDSEVISEEAVINDKGGIDEGAPEGSSSAARGAGSEIRKLKEEIEKLEQTVSDGKAKNDELNDHLLRTLAEMDNLRKRTLKERSELLKYQGERVFVDLIGIADNMDLALQHAEADPVTLRDGVKMIHKMLVELLDRWEVRGSSAIGSKFDPMKHNAIGQMPVTDAAPGMIVNEIKKCYMYKDKMIRPAEVVVAVAPEGKDAQGEAESVVEAIEEPSDTE